MELSRDDPEFRSTFKCSRYRFGNSSLHCGVSYTPSQQPFGEGLPGSCCAAYIRITPTEQRKIPPWASISPYSTGSFAYWSYSTVRKHNGKTVHTPPLQPHQVVPRPVHLPCTSSYRSPQPSSPCPSPNLPGPANPASALLSFSLPHPLS